MKKTKKSFKKSEKKVYSKSNSKKNKKNKKQIGKGWGFINRMTLWNQNYQTREQLAQFGYLPSHNLKIPAHNIKESDLYYIPPKMIKPELLIS